MKKHSYITVLLSVACAVLAAFACFGCAGNKKISLDKTELELYVGQSVTVKATRKAKGEFVWASDNTDIAAVDSDGTVTAVSVGETSVTVTVGKESASISVKVATRPEFTLSQSRAVLEKYDDITVFALLDGEISDAEWSSDNKSVATVSNGTVNAVGAGTAVVKAKIDDRERELTVNVTENGIYPAIELPTEIALNVGKTFDAMPSIGFNSKYKDGGEFTYDIENPNIATVNENGVITGVKSGNTRLTVNGSWKGLNLLPVEVELSVYDDIVYNFASNNVIVATSDRGEEHVNKFALRPEVKVNGNAVDLSDCTFSVDNGEIVSVDSDGLITGLKEGETSVKLRYNGAGAYSATVDVKVYIPVLQSDVTTAIELEALRVDNNDKASVENLFGLDSVSKINFGGSDIPAELDGNKILFDGAKVDRFGEREVTVYSEKVGYTFPMNVISMNISSAQDLAAITRLNTADTVDGIYYVTADFDASAAGVVRLVNNNAESSDTVGFKGVFDGRGHVISNLTTKTDTYNGLGGLFGQLLPGSVVKNVAFIDMKLSSDNKTGENYRSLFVGESKKLLGIVSDVIVTTQDSTARVFNNFGGNGTLNNFMAVGVSQINLDGGNVSVSNIMSVTGNASSNWGGFSWTGNAAYNAQPNFATVEAMLDALEEENTLAAWNSPITYENGAVYFNGTKVIE